MRHRRDACNAMDLKTKWHERLFGKHLIKCDSHADDCQTISTPEAFQDIQITGVYFSFANINQQSDDFIKKLKLLYERLNQDNCDVKKLEVVQVVLWANNDVYSDFENSHRASLLGIPWFAIPFCEIELKVARDFLFKSHT